VETANEFGEPRSCRCHLSASKLRLKATLGHSCHLCRCLDALERSLEVLCELGEAGRLECPAERGQKCRCRLAPRIPKIQIHREVTGFARSRHEILFKEL